MGASPEGYRCVPIDKAAVVNNCSNEIELLASSAKEAGLRNLMLVELIVTEGECIKKL